MATLNSVLGPLDTADLGFTLTHEHVVTASAGILQTYPSCTATWTGSESRPPRP